MPGPVTRARQTRAAIWLGAVLLLALGLIFTAGGTGQLALGLGLALPGAGFWPWVLDDGGLNCLGAPAWISYLGAALISHLLFALALLAWFGAGAAVLPPLVWLGSAVAAALTAPGLAWVHPAFLAAPFTVWPLLRLLSRLRRPTPAAPPWPARPGATLEDTATKGLIRFTLDRALQPVEAFEGFQFVDQFQTAATRYQLAQAGYALALVQGEDQAGEAMSRLIEKQTDHRIWRYWQLENLWGNLDPSPDPVACDNIMYTGFLAAQIALYQRVSGDDQFSRPGALPLTHPSGLRFDTDLGALLEAIRRGWRNSPFLLMPCEPNWIYPLCNAIGGCAMAAAAPGDWAGWRDPFRAALEAEFRDGDGPVVPFRSATTGLPGPRLGGAVVAAYPVLYWNVLYPDLAAELWGQVRAQTLGAGGLRLDRFWKVDTGDYRRSRAASLAGYAAAAAEMGDVEARDLALAALDAECPAAGPVWHRPDASVFAHFTELMARANPGGGYARLFAPVDKPAPVAEP